MSNYRITRLSVLILALTPLLSAAPRLSLNTARVGIVNLATGSNGAESVQASNLGDGSLSLTAASSVPWLSAAIGTKGSCAATGGNCYLITLSLNTASLAPPGYKTCWWCPFACVAA